MLAKNWRESGSLQSAHKLVTSHLRLVAKIAMGYVAKGGARLIDNKAINSIRNKLIKKIFIIGKYPQ